MLFHVVSKDVVAFLMNSDWTNFPWNAIVCSPLKLASKRLVKGAERKILICIYTFFGCSQWIYSLFLIFVDEQTWSVWICTSKVPLARFGRKISVSHGLFLFKGYIYLKNIRRLAQKWLSQKLPRSSLYFLKK